MNKIGNFKKQLLTLRRYSWFNILFKPYQFKRFLKQFYNSKSKGELEDLIHKNISENLSRREERSLYFDIILSNLQNGSSITNYFDYEFYLKKKAERKQYITEDLMGKFHFSFNPPKYCNYFHEKNMTYKIFGQYYNRDVLYVNEEVDNLKFKDFCHKHQEFFIKPHNGTWGIGTKKIKINEFSNLELLFQECLKNRYLIEELIIQHPELAEFHPSSLNTIRITTLVTKDGVKIMRPTYLKFGNNGSINDNYSSGSIAAEIEIDSGIVTAQGVDKFRNHFSKHPMSRKQIVGFRIPLWEKMKQFAQELAMVIPQNRLVGWDLAVTDSERIILVEGNHQPILITFNGIGNRMAYEKALKNY